MNRDREIQLLAIMRAAADDKTRAIAERDIASRRLTAAQVEYDEAAAELAELRRERGLT